MVWRILTSPALIFPTVSRVFIFVLGARPRFHFGDPELTGTKKRLPSTSKGCAFLKCVFFENFGVCSSLNTTVPDEWVCAVHHPTPGDRSAYETKQYESREAAEAACDFVTHQGTNSRCFIVLFRLGLSFSDSENSRTKYIPANMELFSR